MNEEYDKNENKNNEESALNKIRRISKVIEEEAAQFDVVKYHVTQQNPNERQMCNVHRIERNPACII